jgi:hypothetical protein
MKRPLNSEVRSGAGGGGESALEMLAGNSFVYEAGLDWVRSTPAARLPEVVWQVGRLAWDHHPGRFADGALENPVFRLGASGALPAAPAVPQISAGIGGLPRTLHVATTIYALGGHSRVVAKWATRDVHSVPGVVLTTQTEPVPDLVGKAIADAKGEIIVLPAEQPMAARAGILREISRRYDRVILHTHPQDPVPVMAFAAKGGPPVAMFNHAHFSLCLGSTISDVIVNTMEYFSKVTKQFRFPRQATILTGTPGMERLTADPID